MAISKSKSGTNRREFLVGAAFSIGALTGGAGRTLNAEVLPPGAQISGRLEHDSSLCAGCGVCSLMCSLYHNKEVSVSLARSELVRDPIEGTYAVKACRQCLSPSCYQACEKKDSALCIDETTGVKYINDDKCDGCGKCTLACPLDPSRIKLSPVTNIAFKCDLCRERDNGPICIEYCSQNALAIAPGNGEV